MPPRRWVRCATPPPAPRWTEPRDDPFFAAKVGAGPAAAALSALMLGAWAAFAHLGTPGPEWAAAAPSALPVNVLGGPGDLHAADAGWRADELAAWAG